MSPAQPAAAPAAAERARRCLTSAEAAAPSTASATAAAAAARAALVRCEPPAGIGGDAHHRALLLPMPAEDDEGVACTGREEEVKGTTQPRTVEQSAAGRSRQLVMRAAP